MKTFTAIIFFAYGFIAGFGSPNHLQNPSCSPSFTIKSTASTAIPSITKRAPKSAAATAALSEDDKSEAVILDAYKRLRRTQFLTGIALLIYVGMVIIGCALEKKK